MRSSTGLLCCSASVLEAECSPFGNKHQLSAWTVSTRFLHLLLVLSAWTMSFGPFKNEKPTSTLLQTPGYGYRCFSLRNQVHTCVLARSTLNISPVRSSVMPIASMRRSAWNDGVNRHVVRNGSNSGLHGNTRRDPRCHACGCSRLGVKRCKQRTQNGATPSIRKIVKKQIISNTVVYCSTFRLFMVIVVLP